MHDRTMSIYAVTYDYSDDAALRDEHRASHREYLAGLAEQGVVLVSGPWGPDEAPGALLIFRGDSVDAVRELTVDDPFRKVGAVTDVRVQEWIPVLGPLAGGF